MKTMKKLLPVAIALSAISAPALADMSANVTATSNYVWRGVSQTDNGAAIQGGVDYTMGDSGLYAGTWVSTLGGSGSTGFGNDANASSETDFYAGWAADLGDSGLGLDVGYIYYAYLDSDGEVDFGEIYANVSFSIVSAGVSYTTNTGDDNEDVGADQGDIYAWIGASVDLGEDWSVGATIGTYAYENDGEDVTDYSHGVIDLTKSAGDFGDFTLSLSYADEEAQNDDDDVITYVSWSKGF